MTMTNVMMLRLWPVTTAQGPPIKYYIKNHVPPAVPTTMLWPPMRCPHVILKPSPLLILLPSAIPITTMQPTTRLPRTILPPNPLLRLPPHVIPLPSLSTCRVKSPPTALPQTLLFVPPVESSHVAHDLWPSIKKSTTHCTNSATPKQHHQSQ